MTRTDRPSGTDAALAGLDAARRAGWAKYFDMQRRHEDLVERIILHARLASEYLDDGQVLFAIRAVNMLMHIDRDAENAAWGRLLDEEFLVTGLRTRDEPLCEEIVNGVECRDRPWPTSRRPAALGWPIRRSRCV